MNTTHTLFLAIRRPALTPALIIACFTLMAGTLKAADTTPTRIALTPFSAPAGNQKLQNAATVLPDLLTASLSRDNRFQLVEREKINTVWNELHLTEAGLTSADTVAKMGKILSCDWLLSGSLIPATNRTQIWVKVIDTQSSVVLDVKSLPYNATNFSATATNIAYFLAQERTRTGPHEYIALGKFEDRSVSSTREDWTPRLIALIEKHFLDAGYGVVERESVAPVFSEYQLQSAGMTDDAKRVKLKPAFWVVSGGWKWTYDTQDKLSVTISIKKMGGGEQLLSFTKPPGAELENAVVEAIQKSLKSTGSVTAEQALAAEQKLRSAHVDELTKGRGESHTPSRFPTETTPTYITHTNSDGEIRRVMVDPEFTAQNQKHADEMIKSLQQAVLLNPADERAKLKLGMAWFGGADATQSRQGEKMLEDVAKSSDPSRARMAQNWLDDVRSGKIAFTHGGPGQSSIVIKGQPASLPKPVKSTTAVTAGTAPPPEITNVASLATKVATFPGALLARKHFDNITATRLWRGGVFIACGTTLERYDIKSGALQTVLVPPMLKQSITAIELTEGVVWLGTEGGLVRVPLKGENPRIYREKDGFPMAAVSALKFSAGKLYIGFGSGGAGGFGWLDLATDKFASIATPAGTGKSWEERMKAPPETRVLSIEASDADHLWVASQNGLQQLDLTTRSWSQVSPRELVGIQNGFDVNSKYLAALMPSRCAAIYRPSAKSWTGVNMDTDWNANFAWSLALDPAEPDWLWIGGEHGSLTVINLATSQIIMRGRTTSPLGVQWIFPTQDRVVFIARSEQGSFDLYGLDKAGVFHSAPVY